MSRPLQEEKQRQWSLLSVNTDQALYISSTLQQTLRYASPLHFPHVPIAPRQALAQSRYVHGHTTSLPLRITSLSCMYTIPLFRSRCVAKNFMYIRSSRVLGPPRVPLHLGFTITTHRFQPVWCTCYYCVKHYKCPNEELFSVVFWEWGFSFNISWLHLYFHVNVSLEHLVLEKERSNLCSDYFMNFPLIRTQERDIPIELRYF